MLLFSSNEKSQQRDAGNILVVAADTQVMEKICEQLAIRDTGDIRRFNGTVIQLENYTEPADVDVVVFEVSDADTPESVAQLMDLHVSRTAIQIAVGHRDSLVLADSYLQQQIFYCHYPSQLNRVGPLITAKSHPGKEANSAVKMAILGCKGGIGTSSLSYYIAEDIARLRQSPTLLVQGSGGSRNLDLISRVSITNEVTLLQNNFFAMYEEKNHAWFFNNPVYDRHQCVIFDFSAFNASDEDIENVLTHSDCVLLVCDRNLASVRVAKKILEANAHLQSSNNGIKRLYLCFNQHHPKVSGEVNVREVGDLVGQSADVVVPYLLKAGDPSMALDFSGKNKAVLENISYLLLGKKRATKGREAKGNSLFSGIKKQLTRTSD